MLSLNYTSGTTGHPKGVMYSHRGAYLQALAMVAQGGLDTASVFLWTLPMFHCNGGATRGLSPQRAVCTWRCARSTPGPSGRPSGARGSPTSTPRRPC